MRKFTSILLINSLPYIPSTQAFLYAKEDLNLCFKPIVVKHWINRTIKWKKLHFKECRNEEADQMLCRLQIDICIIYFYLLNPVMILCSFFIFWFNFLLEGGQGLKNARIRCSEVTFNMLIWRLWTFLMLIICPFYTLLGILEIVVTVCHKVYWDWLHKSESCVGDIQIFSARYFESWAAAAIKLLGNKANRIGVSILTHSEAGFFSITKGRKAFLLNQLLNEMKLQ